MYLSLYIPNISKWIQISVLFLLNIVIASNAKCVKEKNSVNRNKTQ